nr:Hypothetical protein SC2p2_00050 [Methylocystis sp. SC2]
MARLHFDRDQRRDHLRQSSGKGASRLRAFWERVISGTPLPFNLDGFLGPIFANASANPLPTVGAPGF